MLTRLWKKIHARITELWMDRILRIWTNSFLCSYVPARPSGSIREQSEWGHESTAWVGETTSNSGQNSEQLQCRRGRQWRDGKGNTNFFFNLYTSLFLFIKSALLAMISICKICVNFRCRRVVDLKPPNNWMGNRLGKPFHGFLRDSRWHCNHQSPMFRAQLSVYVAWVSVKLNCFLTLDQDNINIFHFLLVSPHNRSSKLTVPST